MRQPTRDLYRLTRTFRHSYREGIDILYGTNTIHTSSKALVLGADRLLLPQRLLSIASLELLWDFGTHPPWAHSFPAATKDLMDSFEDMLRAVRSSFRGLKSLYISVQWNGRAPVTAYSRYQGQADASAEAVEHMLMRRVDIFLVKHLPASLVDFALAVPSSVYMDQCNKALAATQPIIEHVSDGARHERFWRPVEGGVAHAGYWVRLGQRDLRIAEHGAMSDSLLPHEWILFAQ